MYVLLDNFDVRLGNALPNGVNVTESTIVRTLPMNPNVVRISFLFAFRSFKFIHLFLYFFPAYSFTQFSFADNERTTTTNSGTMQ